ncbi:MAG: hypothetical protein ACREJ6_02135 [Candidatus Methylomirabilis sp.]
MPEVSYINLAVDLIQKVGLEEGTMRRIFFVALALASVAFTGCTYRCQTEFGQEPPLKTPAGVKYWPSECRSTLLYPNYGK